MNPNHQRHILQTCAYIDRSLADAMNALDPASGAGMLFPPYRHDAPPGLRDELDAGMQALREAMRGHFDAEGQSTTVEGTSDLRHMHAALIAADVALAELRPSSMRGYGEWSDEDGARFDVFRERLQALVRGMLAQVERAMPAR